MPGGHEFLKEMGSMVLMSWQQNAIGRLVQRQIAALAELGFAPGGTAVAPATATAIAPSPSKPELPFYAVRWCPPVEESSQQPLDSSVSSHVVDLRCVDLLHNDTPSVLQRKDSQVVVVSKLTGDLLESTALQEELKQCWCFISLIQRCLEAGASGRIIIVCEAAATGGMVVGASKAVAMEASELTIQRVFLPSANFKDGTTFDVSAAVAVARRFPKESDLWIQELPQGSDPIVFAQRLEHTLEPSTKLPCVAKLADAQGSSALYVLTGATGGLGSAVVEWLVNDQQLSPEQLVLLRRAGSAPLSGVLAQCRVVEVSAPDDLDALLSSGLKDIGRVTGIFHLAGVLDDGIIGGMTEERVHKVAKPKCGITVSLLRAAMAFGWPLKWFLGFSSTSSLFGYGGQVNYSAANGMLDQMAVFGSLSSGALPCRVITINWGPWGEAGMAKVGTKAYEQAVREGDTPLKTAVALRCLAAALRSANRAQQAVMQFCACDVEWQRSQWKDLPILHLVAEKQVQLESQAPAAAQNDARPSGRASLEEFMANYTSQSWSKIKGKSLVKLGLDSLEVVQLRNQLNKNFSINVPLKIVAEPSQKLGDLVTALESYLSA